jgi:hypothetical protein
MHKDIVELAKQLYEGTDNKVKPTWEQLMPGGACQGLWIERAQAVVIATVRAAAIKSPSEQWK